MFAELQKRLRKSRLKNPEIAQGTGLSVSLVRQVRKGIKTNPTIQTYQKLTEFLDAVDAARDQKAA